MGRILRCLHTMVIVAVIALVTSPGQVELADLFLLCGSARMAVLAVVPLQCRPTNHMTCPLWSIIHSFKTHVHTTWITTSNKACTNQSINPPKLSQRWSPHSRARRSCSCSTCILPSCIAEGLPEAASAAGEVHWVHSMLLQPLYPFLPPLWQPQTRPASHLITNIST